MSDKQKALDNALAQIERQFGKNTVIRMGDRVIEKIPVIPTGSKALDEALGVKGYPRGRIIEVYGPESSGKTTLALHAVAEVQKAGGKAAFIDAEHALDPEYAKKLGVDVDDLLLSQPDCGEQALEVVDMLTRSGALDIIVIDSVAALTPRAEIEGEMGASHMGLHARLMSQALRKLTGAISNTKTTVFFINQIRMKIGVMFGNPETTTGGNALKFYASMRLDVRRTGSIKKGDEIVGNDTKVKVVKNKMAPPFKIAKFRIMFGEGISKVYEILNQGLENGTILKGGAWYTVNQQRFQGENNLMDALKKDQSLVDFIESDGVVKPVYGSKTSESPIEKKATMQVSDIHEDPSKQPLESLIGKVKKNDENVEKDTYDEVIELGLTNGAIVKKRAWVIVGDKPYHGVADLKSKMIEDESLVDKIIDFV